MTFAEVKIGRAFHRGGTFWRKRSTRTAVIIEGIGEGLWFYWGQKETIDNLVAETVKPAR